MAEPEKKNKPMHDAYIKPLPLRGTFKQYTAFLNPKYYINSDKLNKKEFVLKRESGTTVLHLHNISDGLKNALYKISKNDPLTTEDKDTLSADDITRINEIRRLVRAPNNINGEAIIYAKKGPREPNNNQIMRRIKVLTDEIQSGNDGQEAKDELRRFVYAAGVKGIIPRETEDAILAQYCV